MPCLAVAADRDGRQQLDAASMDLALARTDPRKGFQARRADVQPRAAKDVGRPLLGPQTNGKAEQRHHADQAAAGDGHAPKLEAVQGTVCRKLLPTGLPISSRIAI